MLCNYIVSIYRQSYSSSSFPAVFSLNPEQGSLEPTPLWKDIIDQLEKVDNKLQVIHDFFLEEQNKPHSPLHQISQDDLKSILMQCTLHNSPMKEEQSTETETSAVTQSSPIPQDMNLDLLDSAYVATNEIYQKIRHLLKLDQTEFSPQDHEQLVELLTQLMDSSDIIDCQRMGVTTDSVYRLVHAVRDIDLVTSRFIDFDNCPLSPEDQTEIVRAFSIDSYPQSVILYRKINRLLKLDQTEFTPRHHQQLVEVLTQLTDNNDIIDCRRMGITPNSVDRLIYAAINVDLNTSRFVSFEGCLSSLGRRTSIIWAFSTDSHDDTIALIDPPSRDSTPDASCLEDWTLIGTAGSTSTTTGSSAVILAAIAANSLKSLQSGCPMNDIISETPEQKKILESLSPKSDLPLQKRRRDDCVIS